LRPSGTEVRDIPLLAILETLAEGLAVADARGEVVMVNRALLRLLGHRREDLIGRKLPCLNGVDREGLLNHGGAGAQLDVSYERPDGEELTLRVKALAVQYDGGGALAAVLRDRAWSPSVRRAAARCAGCGAATLATPFGTFSIVAGP